MALVSGSRRAGQKGPMTSESGDGTNTGDKVKEWADRTLESYEQGEDRAGGDRPLQGYGVLLAIYSTLTGAGIAWAKLKGVDRERPSLIDLVLLSVGTFRISRTLAKDAVTSTLRAPFTTYQGRGGPGEVMEAPRPGPVRHAVGELVTCPFCLTQWVGTAGLLGSFLFPRVTRWVFSGMTVVAAADVLHFAYDKLQNSD
jgi:hypothetical protein